ncbi:hypothetical protein [Bacillus tequilensis]|uniref:Uncharacterized protein n=1 Tax=Bacillus tequilensis TaxID=227866 RepID=A0A6H0WJ22_9BACI|nr:hypothetical protein [Bacillus tequilensis]MDR4433932.1 hypothetical protein [Bacillus tequilensis]QIW80134.1 hypothetical protein G4P54_10120 [Bacillus tequilensis]SPT99103.1 Uncharacterised protein [Bacillus tequilensis]
MFKDFFNSHPFIKNVLEILITAVSLGVWFNVNINHYLSVIFGFLTAGIINSILGCTWEPKKKAAS